MSKRRQRRRRWRGWVVEECHGRSERRPVLGTTTTTTTTTTITTNNSSAQGNNNGSSMNSSSILTQGIRIGLSLYNWSCGGDQKRSTPHHRAVRNDETSPRSVGSVSWGTVYDDTLHRTPKWKNEWSTVATNRQKMRRNCTAPKLTAFSPTWHRRSDRIESSWPSSAVGFASEAPIRTGRGVGRSSAAGTSPNRLSTVPLRKYYRCYHNRPIRCRCHVSVVPSSSWTPGGDTLRSKIGERAAHNKQYESNLETYTTLFDNRTYLIFLIQSCIHYYYYNGYSVSNTTTCSLYIF